MCIVAYQSYVKVYIISYTDVEESLLLECSRQWFNCMFMHIRNLFMCSYYSSIFVTRSIRIIGKKGWAQAQI